MEYLALLLVGVLSYTAGYFQKDCQTCQSIAIDVPAYLLEPQVTTPCKEDNINGKVVTCADKEYPSWCFNKEQVSALSVLSIGRAEALRRCVSTIEEYNKNPYGKQ